MNEITRHTHKFFLQSAERHMDLRMGPQSTYEPLDIARVLEHAAANVVSPTEASGQLKELDLGLPDGDSVFHHLERQPLDRLEACFDSMVGDAVAEARRQRLLGAPVEMAFDISKERWYGRRLGYMVRGPADRGTTRFIGYASGSIATAGRRLVIRTRPVGPETRLEDLVLDFIGRAEELELRILRIYLDREFCITPVLRLFHELQVGYVMPARMTPEVKRLKKQMLRDKRYIATYTMRGEAGEVETTLFLHYHRKKRRWIPFVTNLPVTEANRASLGEAYRHRWAIETAFRTRNHFRVRTCSAQRNVRYALYMMGVLLYNLWVLLNVWEARWFGETPRKPRVTVFRFHFHLERLLHTGQW